MPKKSQNNHVTKTFKRWKYFECQRWGETKWKYLPWSQGGDHDMGGGMGVGHLGGGVLVGMDMGRRGHIIAWLTRLCWPMILIHMHGWNGLGWHGSNLALYIFLPRSHIITYNQKMKLPCTDSIILSLYFVFRILLSSSNMYQFEDILGCLYVKKQKQLLKINLLNLVTSLNHTLNFEWYVVRCGSKNIYQ